MDEDGMLFEHYFEKSSIDNARDRIKKMDEDDLMIQLQIIEKSLATEIRNVHEYFSDSETTERDNSSLEPLLSREALLGEARELYTEIMENRFVARDGDYSWLSEQYDLARSGTSLSFMGPSLYDGLLGVGVFSAALYEITQEERHFKTAEHCLEKAGKYLEVTIPNMERYQMNLGYSSGISGYIAGLSLTSRYLKTESGYELAEKMILGITQKMIRADTTYDILGGVSGLVLALTQEERWLKHAVIGSHVEQLLRWCGEHLLSQQNVTTKDGIKIWNSKESIQSLTGLGHGAAGIASALFRLGQILGEERFFEAGKAAILYENSVFDPQAGNWPDFRKDPSDKSPKQNKFMGGYCAGAPGIGLSRLDILSRIENSGFAAEIEAELLKDIQRTGNFIRSIHNEGRNHLCCGGAGRVDFLIEEGHRLKDQEAMSLAHRKLSDLILGKQKRGHYNFHTVNGKYYYNPTLFQGTAGIGYEILRFLDPERIQSVLI